MSFGDHDIAEFEAFIEELADLARAQTLPRFRDGADISDKEGPIFDPVTDADKKAEGAIRDRIAAVYPAHGVLGEEYGESKGEGPWRWVIDPVDGTRAFVCGAATWTTLIALEYEGASVLSVIDQPFIDERWIGRKNETIFKRAGEQQVCKTSSVKGLAKARLSTTDPRPPNAAYFTKEEAATFERLANETQVERFSMDAYAYGLLAFGELDLVVETSLQRHDYASLVPVVEGAGGVITNWRGEPVGSDARGETLAAATPELHAAAMAALAG